MVQECIYSDVGVSETAGTNSRYHWHRLDRRLVAGDTLVVVAIDRDRSPLAGLDALYAEVECSGDPHTVTGPTGRLGGRLIWTPNPTLWKRPMDKP